MICVTVIIDPLKTQFWTRVRLPPSPRHKSPALQGNVKSVTVAYLLRPCKVKHLGTPGFDRLNIQRGESSRCPNGNIVNPVRVAA